MTPSLRAPRRRALPLALAAVVGALTVAPPVAAAAAALAGPPHGLGALPPGRSAASPAVATVVQPTAASLPASVSLIAYAEPVGDQGQVGSCAAWATDYSALGWWMRRDGIAGSALAPMYTYSQIVDGQDVGSDPAANLDLAIAQGVDTQADYTQGNLDYWDLPTAAETAHAGGWRLSSYTALPLSGNASATVTQNAIETALAASTPVVISIPVYANFENLGSAAGGLYSGPAGRLEGYHAVTALGYSASGLLIENQWGTDWGNAGYATLSWSFVNDSVYEALAVGDLEHVHPMVTATSSASTGQSLTFAATGTSESAANGQLTQFAWHFDDGTTATGASVTHVFATAGAHSATVSVTDSLGQTESATAGVTVTAVPPTAQATSNVDGAVARTNVPVDFDGAGSAPAPGDTLVGYSWSFGDGSTSTSASPSHVYAAPGSYAVSLTVTDSDTGTATATDTVNVQAGPAPASPPTTPARAPAPSPRATQSTLVAPAPSADRVSFGRGWVNAGLASVPYRVGASGASTRVSVALVLRRGVRTLLVPDAGLSLQAVPGSRGVLRVRLDAAARRVLSNHRGARLTAAVRG